MSSANRACLPPQASSPCKVPRPKDASSSHAMHESDAMAGGAEAPRPNGTHTGAHEDDTALSMSGGKRERPADVAEMYVSYYDVAEVESPGRKRVIDLLHGGQSPSSDDRHKLKRAKGGACATGDHVLAEGSSSRAGPQQPQARPPSEEEDETTLERAARSLENALDRALFLLVTHAGPPESTRNAVRSELERAGEELCRGIAMHHDKEEDALVLLDCAFSMLVRLRASQDVTQGLGAYWSSWVASEWKQVVERNLRS